MCKFDVPQAHSKHWNFLTQEKQLILHSPAWLEAFVNQQSPFPDFISTKPARCCGAAVRPPTIRKSDKSKRAIQGCHLWYRAGNFGAPTGVSPMQQSSRRCTDSQISFYPGVIQFSNDTNFTLWTSRFGARPLGFFNNHGQTSKRPSPARPPRTKSGYLKGSPSGCHFLNFSRHEPRLLNHPCRDLIVFRSHHDHQ